MDAFETLRASHRGGFLGCAVAYDNRQTEIPADLIYSLRWHPVRLISFLDRPYYYGAKKKYLDWIAARQLATGRYELVSQLVRRLSPNAPRRPTKMGIPSTSRDPDLASGPWKIDGRPSTCTAPAPYPPVASALEGKSSPNS